jgi:hypothetical protein
LPGIDGLSVIHTGDFLDKKSPDLKVLDFFGGLEKQIIENGGFAKILAGNHEQEIWQQIADGETFGLPEASVSLLREKIESIDLFYVDGPLLFMHSYPTVEFLQALLHYKNETDNHLNSFNNDRYRKAFESKDLLRQYSYARNVSRKKYMLYEPSNIESYFRKNGSEIAALLTALEIDCVIHGHKPQRKGIQADYEFQKWLQGIRIIGNDTRVRQQGIGATVIRIDLGRAPEVVFINADNTNKKTRNKIKHLLRNSAPVSDAFRRQSEEIEHFKKLQKQLEALSKSHKNQLVKLENELHKQQTNNLLMREEIAEQADNLHEQKEKYELLLHENEALKKAISLRNEQLKNKFSIQENSNVHLQQELTEQEKQLSAAREKLDQLLQLKLEMEKELSDQELKLKFEARNEDMSPGSVDTSDLKPSSDGQEASVLNKTITDLHEEIKQSNQTRKQAIRYLRVCHEKSQEIAQDLEHCIEEKNTVEISFEQQLQHEQEARVKLDGSLRRWRLYSIIASALIVVLIMVKFI